MKLPEGRAIVYCEGAFNTPNGKTSHGLVRFTRRYRVLSVVDSLYSGQDAGMVLDGKNLNVPVIGSIRQAVSTAQQGEAPATHLVVGLAPDGGRLPKIAREHVKEALSLGLNVDSGVHDFLSEDPEMVELARSRNLVIRDIRKPPDRNQLHFFSGKIEAVDSLKIAVLGTDSAIGKRTTAWLLVQALKRMGYPTEMVGTGQTAWMQGARYGIILDSLINDFISGEIEHAIWLAWKDQKPAAIVIEGQGSLMNPAYPGGFEILAAGRPDLVILQHAPARKDYDGFPGYPIQSLPRQIQAIEVLSGKPVVAIAINHEHIAKNQINKTCQQIQREINLPTFDVLEQGADGLTRVLIPLIKARTEA